MKTKLIAFFLAALVLPFLLFSKNKPLQGKMPKKTAPIILKYNFTRSLPSNYVVKKSGNIYVENANVIYEFNAQGVLIKRIAPPAGNKNDGIRSIAVSENEQILYYYLVSKKAALFGYDIKGNKVIYRSYFRGGGDIKYDKNGVMYLPYQDYPDFSKPALNKFRVFDKEGRNYDYPTSINLDGGFEVFGTNIICFTGEKVVYFLPVIGSSNMKITTISLREVSSNYGKFLGVINGNYLFYDHDYKRDIDIIDRYDANFKFIDSTNLHFTKNEVILGNDDEGDTFQDIPSGSVYYYDHNNHIYFLRHTMRGTLLYNLADFLKQ